MKKQSAAGQLGMANVWLIGDTHFHHRNIVKFLRMDGSKVRPWDTIEEHDEALIGNWNRVVKPDDKVYHLGDVAFGRRGWDCVDRLNGRKTLIMGNHDHYKHAASRFADIKGSHELDNILLTHIPVNIGQAGRWRGNFHGHLHTDWLIDPFYLCLSAEHLDFTPILFEQARARWQANLRHRDSRNSSTGEW